MGAGSGQSERRLSSSQTSEVFRDFGSLRADAPCAPLSGSPWLFYGAADVYGK